MLIREKVWEMNVIFSWSRISIFPALTVQLAVTTATKSRALLASATRISRCLWKLTNGQWLLTSLFQCHSLDFIGFTHSRMEIRWRFPRFRWKLRDLQELMCSLKCLWRKRMALLTSRYLNCLHNAKFQHFKPTEQYFLVTIQTDKATEYYFPEVFCLLCCTRKF